MTRGFVVIDSAPEVENLLLQYSGWGYVAQRNGATVLYVNNPALIIALKAAGGQELGRTGRSARSMRPQTAVKLGVTLRGTVDETITALVGHDDWDFNW